MRVAAYQAPLLASGSMDALRLIELQVRRCEAEGVAILCCPEAILGGLADSHANPLRFAIPAERLNAVLAPLSSHTVTTIVGLTELWQDEIYNTAVVFRHGQVAGSYRKLHPAIRRSVYTAGSECPVFQVGDLTFGIVICNDSNYSEPVQRMAREGARALFIPTNNALPRSSAHREVAEAARRVDVVRAAESQMWVIRADVAGSVDGMISDGSSGIVDPNGNVYAVAEALTQELLFADLMRLTPGRDTRD